MINPIIEAWQAGRPVQYFQLLGHDSEWTDYTQNVPPTLSPMLEWRVKPPPPSAATAEEASKKIDLTPPPGYTAEELERDNPHNAWMHDMSLETSEADARPGETLGNGHPDWPDDLTTYAERKAYQRGVADARHVAKTSVQLERLVDFVARVTQREAERTRHDAILALKQLGVWE